MERQLVFWVWLNRADPEIDKLETDVRLEGMICLEKIVPVSVLIQRKMNAVSGSMS